MTRFPSLPRELPCLGWRKLKQSYPRTQLRYKFRSFPLDHRTLTFLQSSRESCRAMQRLSQWPGLPKVSSSHIPHSLQLYQLDSHCKENEHHSVKSSCYHHPSQYISLVGLTRKRWSSLLVKCLKMLFQLRNDQSQCWYCATLSHTH